MDKGAITKCLIISSGISKEAMVLGMQAILSFVGLELKKVLNIFWCLIVESLEDQK